MVKVTLLGYLGRDAIVRSSQNGQFISMSLCCNQRDKAMWFDATYNCVSEKLLPYLKRGQQVLVIGSATWGQYTDGNGTVQCYCKVAIDTLQLCGQIEKKEQPVNVAAEFDKRELSAAMHDAFGHDGYKQEDENPF